MSSSLSLEFVWHGKLHRLKGLFKDKDENNIGDTKDEKKVEEREKDEGSDRNKDGRSKADDENKALFGGHKVKTQRANPVSKNNDGSYSYPLVNPRPEEAPDIDNSTLVQCTGKERSPVHPSRRDG